MAVVPQQFRSKSRPNRGVLTGRNEEDPLGKQISKHRQVIVPLAPVHLVGTHPNHGVETQALAGRRNLSDEHPPHPPRSRRGSSRHVSLASPASGSRRRPRTPASSAWSALPGRGHTVHLAVVATASSRQRTHDHALLVENVKVPTLNRLDMVVANHRGPGARSFL